MYACSVFSVRYGSMFDLTMDYNGNPPPLPNISGANPRFSSLTGEEVGITLLKYIFLCDFILLDQVAV